MNKKIIIQLYTEKLEPSPTHTNINSPSNFLPRKIDISTVSTITTKKMTDLFKELAPSIIIMVV